MPGGHSDRRRSEPEAHFTPGSLPAVVAGTGTLDPGYAGAARAPAPRGSAAQNRPTGQRHSGGCAVFSARHTTKVPVPMPTIYDVH